MFGGKHLLRQYVCWFTFLNLMDYSPNVQNHRPAHNNGCTSRSHLISVFQNRDILPHVVTYNNASQGNNWAK